jgi:Raf kinase inhibitor-like YbhB/YbcL family protein
MDWDAPSPRLRLFPVVHWILYNIPADTTEIPQNSNSGSLGQKGINSGLNVGRQLGYTAPCPPFDTHRYEFRVYALDVDRIQPVPNDRPGLMQAMDRHILAYGELVGLNGP